jgi:hypothetical protein
MQRRPIQAAAIAGALGAVLLFMIQMAMQAMGIGGPPTGVAVATTMLHLSGPAALLVGVLLFALAGAAWGALYAAIVPRITPLTGLIFGLAPSLFALLVMLPLLGKPAFAGGDPKGILTPLVLNSIWGLFVGAVTPMLAKGGLRTM